ncbi:winged helix DNA-binding protein [Altericroceibacterium endophyticum]|uniref:Winged helix DNA-binding protein n=1 Tax=Altericroceibacterium endophyticum TaxID=1808508 RepID=A0A6I4T1X7_9SPHN|nr:winged helix DNA-binding protein [Altericroceibacterium endophyticum]MXO64967.1 winged helix DNA-binding protein [Altericroceibacterium endophyticum]
MGGELIYQTHDGQASVGCSIFADRADIRHQLQEDCDSAGLSVSHSGPLSSLREMLGARLGEIIFIDCPEIDAMRLASLAEMDMYAQRSGARLLISTSLAALNDVFACVDQSDPQMLVEAGRAERIVAMGQALADWRMSGVREWSEHDRMTLLRLSEEVTGLAQRLDQFGLPAPQADHTNSAFSFGEAEAGKKAGRAQRPALPDARLVRQIIQQRQARARFFDAGLFADPAWDMLLDLTAARVEHQRVSVTSLCIAADVPPTTALRWISQMTESGWLQRVADDQDKRRAFIDLSDKAADAMACYFADQQIGGSLI